MHLVLLAALSLGQTVGGFSDGPVAYRDAPAAVMIGGVNFTGQALNSSKTTTAIKVKGYRYLKLTLNYTYAAAASVTMTCQNSEDATTWSDIHVIQYATFPTANSAPQVWSYAAGASKIWDWAVAVQGVYMRCTFSATGSPTAGDLLTVTGRAGF